MGKTKDDIILNLDANIVIALDRSGWKDLIPAISKIDGIRIEMTDLVADIELANQYTTQDGITHELGHARHSLRELINNAQRSEFKEEFAENALDIDGSYSQQIDDLKAGNYYKDTPAMQADIVIMPTVYGSEIARDLEDFGNDYIDVVRKEYKSRGEMSMIERENYAQDTIENRFIITNDGTTRNFLTQPPDYISKLDDGNQVNVANLKGLLQQLEFYFEDEINNNLPEKHTPFSAEQVLNDIHAEYVALAEHKGNRAQQNWSERKTIDHNIIKQGFDTENNKPVATIKEGTYRPLKNALDRLSRQIDIPEHTISESHVVSVSETATPKPDTSISSPKPDVQIGRENVELKTYSRKEVAEALDVNPKNNTYKKIWSELEDVAKMDKGLFSFELGERGEETQLGQLPFNGSTQIFVTNPRAVYDEMTKENPDAFPASKREDIATESPNPDYVMASSRLSEESRTAIKA